MTKTPIFVFHTGKLRKYLQIVAVICLVLIGLTANAASPDEKKPGDDKKNKTKREDTTRFAVNPMGFEESSEDEVLSPDSLVIEFPSHDLYSSWDTSTAHPYRFSESFKEDSVVLTLTTENDNCFVMPYKGRELTSLFGWRKYRPHFGTDINLETGDTVQSVFDGMVRVARYYRGYGNCVIVRHNNGLETVYAHLSKILVESGQMVGAGTMLGLGGNTGHSYGSHLHFEIRYLGQALDAQDFIDFEKGDLKSNTFVLRKSDVANKYDLRALHARHKRDLGMARGRHAPVKGHIYRVRSGDTLGQIARRSHTTVKSLCKKNGLRANSVLRVGMKLKI
jgi:murein DD-endopeptidase MepM/ murein hydrolase activator NlpD